jgi:hypothetical protein
VAFVPNELFCAFCELLLQILNDRLSDLRIFPRLFAFHKDNVALTVKNHLLDFERRGGRQANHFPDGLPGMHHLFIRYDHEFPFRSIKTSASTG